MRAGGPHTYPTVGSEYNVATDYYGEHDNRHASCVCCNNSCEYVCECTPQHTPSPVRTAVSCVVQ